MSELQKFLFEGLPVRGSIVRLTDAWGEVLRRRASNSQSGPYPAPVAELLGEMLAAAVLMQSSIRFDGALVMQIMGDGPVKLAVVEVQSDLALRATATVVGPLAPDVSLSAMVNPGHGARCAITLDPRSRSSGRQPYQGVVPLVDAGGKPLQRLGDVVQHYMQQSEQLDTTLVLAADASVAAGLLIQRLPVQGGGNLAAGAGPLGADQAVALEHYRRIATLAASLTRSELLTLPSDAIVHRLFWQEQVLRFAPPAPPAQPRFACSCSREKVASMIVGLGEAEAASILAERSEIEVGCEFCGLQYRFDPVDAAQLFHPGAQMPTMPGRGPH